MNEAINDSRINYLENLKSKLEGLIGDAGLGKIDIPKEDLDKYVLQLEQVKTTLENLEISQANLKAGF